MRAAWPVLLLLGALAGCDRGDERKAAAPAAAARPTLVGAWRTEQPARFAGEGLRTETRDGRTVYRPDGGFDYRGRLIIFGEKLPAEGLGFDMQGRGEWRAANRILTERFTAMQIVPDGPNPVLEKLAAEIAKDLVARPPVRSDIQALDEWHLMLRDRETGTVASFAREGAVVAGQEAPGAGSRAR